MATAGYFSYKVSGGFLGKHSDFVLSSGATRPDSDLSQQQFLQQPQPLAAALTQRPHQSAGLALPGAEEGGEVGGEGSHHHSHPARVLQLSQ